MDTTPTVKCESCGRTEKTLKNQLGPLCNNMSCSEYHRTILPPPPPGKKYVRIHGKETKICCLREDATVVVSDNVTHAIDSLVVEVRNKQKVYGSIPDSEFIKRRREELLEARQETAAAKRIVDCLYAEVAAQKNNLANANLRVNQERNVADLMQRNCSKLERELSTQKKLLEAEKAKDEGKELQEARKMAVHWEKQKKAADCLLEKEKEKREEAAAGLKKILDQVEEAKKDLAGERMMREQILKNQKIVYEEKLKEVEKKAAEERLAMAIALKEATEAVEELKKAFEKERVKKEVRNSVVNVHVKAATPEVVRNSAAPKPKNTGVEATAVGGKERDQVKLIDQTRKDVGEKEKSVSAVLPPAAPATPTTTEEIRVKPLKVVTLNDFPTPLSSRQRKRRLTIEEEREKKKRPYDFVIGYSTPRDVVEAADGDKKREAMEIGETEERFGEEKKNEEGPEKRNSVARNSVAPKPKNTGVEATAGGEKERDQVKVIDQMDKDVGKKEKRNSAAKASQSKLPDEIAVLNSATPRPEKMVVDAVGGKQKRQSAGKKTEKEDEEPVKRRSTRLRKSVDYSEFTNDY